MTRALQQIDIAKLIQTTRIPLASLTGGMDRYISEEDRKFYKEHAWSHIADDIVPNSGHWLTIEAFDETCEWLRSNIARFITL